MDKPKSIEDSPFKSAKWDELTKGREFSSAEVPSLVLLCQWYEVVDQCISDITYGDGLKMAYQGDNGDIKPFPQLATMKQASAEIRALNKQLGISEHEAEQRPLADTPLQLIINRRADGKGRVAAS